jgi:hypothetical protein
MSARSRKPRRGQRPPTTCAHDWVVVDRHYLAGLAHTLQRCRRCAVERLVRSDGKVIA